MNLFKKILIANRGEIALRILNAAKEMGIMVVVIYTTDDKNNLLISKADESYRLEGESLHETYLNMEQIIAIAKKANADAIHPGYGFLSENADFAELCIQNEITWIGPAPAVMCLMADKAEARKFVKALNIPVSEAVYGSSHEIQLKASEIQFPVIIKAVAGGGGRGMRIARNTGELADMLEVATREAKQYFGNPEVFIEQYIENAKHIEVQVLGDKFGNIIHLFERECSVQRRHQKIIEEAPSSVLTENKRKYLYGLAISIANAAKYDSVGTIEFLCDKNGQFYFLEMNTRIQVEHPVTEAITGVDLVKEQILVAAGNPLRLRQENITKHGHAIECRICAEDIMNGLAPSAGFVNLHIPPSGENIRIDTSLESSFEIDTAYDSMIAKQITFGTNRSLAIIKVILGLDNYILQGIDSNIPLLKEIIKSEEFQANTITTDYIETNLAELRQNILYNRNLVPVNIIIISSALVFFQINLLNKNRQNQDVWHKLGYWRLVQLIPVIWNDKEYNIDIKIISNYELELNIGIDFYKINLKKYANNYIEFECNNDSYSFYYSIKNGNEFCITIQGNNYVTIIPGLISKSVYSISKNNIINENNGLIIAPIPGKVIKIMVSEGTIVEKGSVLAIIESMKTENKILADYSAIVNKIFIEEGQKIKAKDELLILSKTN
jgi:acetyl/propionyl-CoA carboxylase alpha subunit